MDILISLVILIYSAILHEIAHGYVADRLGDPTARLLGRLTLNPRPHIDPILSIALPLLLFIASKGTFILGGAKPVPVDPYNLRDGRKDMALVSLAGPLTNVLLALAASLMIHLIFPNVPFAALGSINILGLILETTVRINLLLAIFNLLPIPPLDGSKVVATLLPDHLADAYLSIGRFGMILLFILLMSPVGGINLSALIGEMLRFSLALLGL